jgi:hypothetical protein
MSDEELHVHLIPELLSEIASLRRQITEARAKAIEDAAKVADAHKGQAARDRAKKPKPFGGWGDEVFAEERGEDIAAEVIAAAICSLSTSQGEQGR